MKGTITYGVEFTRNLGNFENVKPRFEMTVELNDDQNPEDVKNSLTDRVDTWLTDKVAELEAELKELGLGKN